MTFRREHLPHHDREHVYRPSDAAMPPVEATLEVPAWANWDNVWDDLKRVYCEDCAHVIYVPLYHKLDRTGHCTGCDRLTHKKPIYDD